MRKLENCSCPNCGQKMEEGYIYSLRNILWTKDGKDRLFNFPDETEVLGELPIFKSKKSPAYRCKNCMIAIFEYD